MEGAGGKRLGSLPRALQHPEMNHSHCLSTYCNMNVWYLRRLSDLWNHMQLVRRHPGKKLRLKRGASDVWKEQHVRRGASKQLDGVQASLEGDEGALQSPEQNSQG